jgi:dTDP-L-rhamnose 4-epimerase
MRVLVTGAAGFIGTCLTSLLRAESDLDVVGLDLLHPAAHRHRDMPDGVLLGDVRDPAVVAAAVRGVDVVIHLAAMVGLGVDLGDLPEYVSCNDLGTAVLLAAMAEARVTRLILASSMVVYGEGAYECSTHGRVRPAPRHVVDLSVGRFEPACPHCREQLIPLLIDEEARLDPRSVYAATKVAQEHLCSAWATASAGRCLALRYHNVYGPGMPRDTPYAGVAAIFRSALERGDSPRVFEDGRQRRDFVHVKDVARANLAALRAIDRFDAGFFRAYNVASGEPRTIGDMASAMAASLAGPAPVITRDYRAGDVRHITASPLRARRELDFSACVTFAEGIQEFVTAPLRA